jgi:peptidoglycan/LPS O-acetylase OafA/YrhL
MGCNQLHPWSMSSSSGNPAAPFYRPDIDGLRAVAVLAVIGFHAFGRWVPGGFAGVDVFFVISGFLISSIIFKALDEGRFSFSSFYARRVRRIFPALVVVLSATWALGWFTLMADEYRQLGKEVVSGAGFVSNFLFWKQTGYFDASAELKPLLHLWSLAVEEQYYLLWPLALFLVWKMRVRPLRFILWVLVASFALNVGTLAFDPAGAFYLPHTRFWELMIGSALAYLQLFKGSEFDDEIVRIFFIARWRDRLPEIKGWLGLVLIVAAFGLLNRQSAFPGCWALVPALGTFLLISAGPDAGINRRLFSNQILVFIGLISYPLYLWHWPLLCYVRLSASGNHPAAMKLIIVVLAFVLAWLTYQFVEKPVRQSGRFAARALAVPLLASVMSGVAVLGALTVQANGLPGRYPEALQNLMRYRDDEHTASWRSGKCFLRPKSDWRAFDSACTDAEPQDGPLVFLWGDSHAADLYPGLRQLRSGYRFRIAQYTTANCPPVVAFDDPPYQFCKPINDWVFEKITELRPRSVVLAAQYWFLSSPQVRAKLSSTVAALKKAGVTTVVLVGPNPHWTQPLPRSLFVNYYRSFHTLPDRMTYNLDDETLSVDRQMNEWASEAGVLYLSPIHALCNPSGCLTRVEENGRADLTAFDQHHLTDVGSQYVASLIFTPLFARATAMRDDTWRTAPSLSPR